MDYAIVDGIEDVEVSLGTNGRKKLAKKLGIEVVDVNKLLYSKSLAKAPPNKTKSEIEAIDAAKVKKNSSAATGSSSYGIAENKGFIVGSPDKPIEQNFEVMVGKRGGGLEKRVIPATTYGLVAVHQSTLPYSTPKDLSISVAPSGLSLTISSLSRKRTTLLAKELAALDWGDGNPYSLPTGTKEKAQEIISKYKK